MTLEMGDADEGVCHIDLMGDGDCFEKRFVNPDLDGAISPQAIGDQERGIDDRLCESILIGGGQVGDRLTPGSGIEGVGIG